LSNLAKNAGTSVDQIERFYTRNLPLPSGHDDGEPARNMSGPGYWRKVLSGAWDKTGRPLDWNAEKYFKVRFAHWAWRQQSDAISGVYDRKRDRKGSPQLSVSLKASSITSPHS
jgi:hypothetical protein